MSIVYQHNHYTNPVSWGIVMLSIHDHIRQSRRDNDVKFSHKDTQERHNIS